RLSNAETTLDTFVVLTENETVYEMTSTFDVNQIEVDPEYHLFRKLYPEEVEPIISAVMGFENKTIVSYINDSTANQNFSEFAKNLTGGDIELITDTRQDFGDGFVKFNPTTIPNNLNYLFSIFNDMVTIDDKSYSIKNHTVVFSTLDNEGDKGMIVFTNDYQSLPRIGQLLPHYGKYSYLVFKGGRNVAKGQWPVTESPLKVTVK
ncbi:MAG: hypothetical protein KAR20_14480, partial [Candidatus Heimdallarchaeota archaeon]|nr:hypothetical protein [Candidatus Heimdallarchaeota archaeon]